MGLAGGLGDRGGFADRGGGHELDVGVPRGTYPGGARVSTPRPAAATTHLRTIRSRVKEYYEELWERLPEDLAPPDFRRCADGSRWPTSPAGERVLDLGCGDRRLRRRPRRTPGRRSIGGRRRAGGALERAGRRHPELELATRRRSTARCPSTTGPSTLVWSSEVIEHVADTARWLSEVRRVLAPRGRLLLTTPSHGRLRLLAGGIERYSEPLGDHLHLYSAALPARAAGRLRLRRDRGTGSRRSAAVRGGSCWPARCADRCGSSSTPPTPAGRPTREPRSTSTVSSRRWPRSPTSTVDTVADARRRPPGGGGLASVANALEDQRWTQYELPRRARAARADVIHHPLPAHAYAPGAPPQVITVHDLAFEVLPAHFVGGLPPLRAAHPPSRRPQRRCGRVREPRHRPRRTGALGRAGAAHRGRAARPRPGACRPCPARSAPATSSTSATTSRARTWPGSSRPTAGTPPSPPRPLALVLAGPARSAPAGVVVEANPGPPAAQRIARRRRRARAPRTA